VFCVCQKRQTPEGEIPLPQDSTACLRELRDAVISFPAVTGEPVVAVLTMPRSLNHELVSVPPLSYPHETFARAGMPGRMGHNPKGYHQRQMLLRKEVIQPHLPVRLPCYDFVPIADPTFDGSLHKGWATGFGCYRLS
jgi:hypothetical protein